MDPKKKLPFQAMSGTARALEKKKNTNDASFRTWAEQLNSVFGLVVMDSHSQICSSERFVPVEVDMVSKGKEARATSDCSRQLRRLR